MSDILNIGLSGLIAYRTALTVTSQNMANVKTPFYSRKITNFSEGLFNNGVNVLDITRAFSQAASNNLLQANTNHGMSNAYQEQMTQLETMLQGSTIGSYLNQAISGLKDLDVDPSSMGARSIYLNKLTDLATRFNNINQQMQQQQQDINLSLQTITSSVNQIAEQIADLNQQISSNQVQGFDNSALLDQQQGLIQQLGQYFNFTTTVDNLGQTNIILGNGAQLVTGNQTVQMNATANPSNANNMLITLASGNTTVNITNFITSGEMAGLYNTQTQIQAAEHALGQLATCIMSNVNAQNKLGIDYNGNLGGNIFIDVNNSVAISSRVFTTATNTGTENLTVNINNASQLTTSDYTLQFDSPTHYTLTRISDQTVVSSGNVSTLPQAVSADGFTINLNSGMIAQGDTFTISPTNGMANTIQVAIQDPKLIALGWPVAVTGSNPKGGMISVTSITDTTNSAFSIPGQLNPPIKVVFTSATQYQLLNANDSSLIEGPITYAPGTNNALFPTPGGYDPGYRVNISGVVNPNDTFNIGYQTNAPGDNANGRAMEALYIANTMNNGSTNFANAYNLLSTNVSLATSQAKTLDAANKSIHQQAGARYAQVSEVSMEEEHNNLLIYQQAYQASAQILEVAKNIFDVIIGLGK